MDSLVERCRSYDVPVDLIREAVTLIRECADLYHHSKEDLLLFPFLVELGANGMRATIQKFSDDHVQNRAYYRTILRGADKNRTGRPAGPQNGHRRRKVILDCASQAYPEGRSRAVPTIEKKLKDSQKRKLWEMLEEYEDAGTASRTSMSSSTARANWSSGYLMCWPAFTA